MVEPHRTYQKAAEIADQLLVVGVPLIGFEVQDYGDKLAFVFQLDDERAKYICRIGSAEASAERVRELFEAVA